MRTLLLLVASLHLPALAQEHVWLNVAPPRDGVAVHAPLSVEVDVSSVRSGPLGTHALLRVTAGQDPWTHRSGYRYRSFTAVVGFDCDRGALLPLAASYFGGDKASGAELGSDSNLTQAGLPAGLLDVLPAAARQALLKAACKRMT